MAQSLSKLAYIAEMREDSQEAATYYQKALDIAQEILGPDHPETALIQSDLARLKGEP